MENSRILIWNSEDPAIKTLIEPFGYTTQKLDEGKALFTEVEALAENQRKEYAEQYTVSTRFIEKRQDAETQLINLRKFSKFIFRKNPEAYNTLGLGSALPTNFADWLQAARYYYERLLEHPEWITILAPFKVTSAMIETNHATLSELKTLQELRQRETGDAQRATKERDAKFEELNAWCSELRQLAKLLFEDADAQYLEKLGIMVRS